MTSARIDSELVRRGLVPSRSAAAQAIAGGHVRVDGGIVRRAAVRVDPDCELRVDAPVHGGFASRAALKLAGALESLQAGGSPLQIDGVRALDVGASTGGFTDVLLARGASAVVALDVGHGQLIQRLRDHPDVTVIEGFNARELTREDLPWQPGLIVADVSFISLELLIGPLATVLAPGGTLLLMVKPQFEVGRERLGSDGVVRSLSQRAETIVAVGSAAEAAGLAVAGVIASCLPGPGGNHEFFLWLTDTRGTHGPRSSRRFGGPVGGAPDPSGSVAAAHRDREPGHRAASVAARRAPLIAAAASAVAESAAHDDAPAGEPGATGRGDVVRKVHRVGENVT